MRALTRRLEKLENAGRNQLVEIEAVRIPMIWREGEDYEACRAKAIEAWEQQNGRRLDRRAPVIILSARMPRKCSSPTEWSARYAPVPTPGGTA